MRQELQFTSNSASAAEIARHLVECDSAFVPPLSTRVDIESYARKIVDQALRFEARADGALVGLVATYFDVSILEAFITNVSVSSGFKRRGVANFLLSNCVEHIALLGGTAIRLEVAAGNAAAIALYQRQGFAVISHAGESIIMKIEIGRSA